VESTLSPEPPARYEHFEILRREDGSSWHLGHGAMGVTYKALDTRLHQHVALKVISGGLTSYPTARARFLREARTAARLHHPNVARVFHLGETAGGTEAFYAMEFVEGETLEARVRRGGPLSVWLVLEIGIQVARALVAACHQNLVHRDLKPANLMLVTALEAATLAAVGRDSSHGEVGEAWVKIIDFGLAKAVADAGPLTGAGDFIGTPAYASPEQFESRFGTVDARSDIYSLGGTLWFALTGRMPFEGGSLTEIHEQKLSGAAPAAKLASTGVPAPLVRLLASMLAADPGDRPRTPTILLEALHRCREELRQLALPGPDERAHGSFPWKPSRSFRHRRIYQVFLGYAVGAWLLLQVSAIVLPGLGWPHWIMRPVIVTLLAGFGEALILGWALDRRATGQALLPQRTGRRVGFVLLALAPAVVVGGYFLWQRSPAVEFQENRPSLAQDLAALPGASAALVPAKSIAVLPFQEFSADQEDAYFAAGIQDEILTDLAKVADLKVISRTSVAQYKNSKPHNLREIAATLGVANVLEGSVQRAGNLIRITVQLIDARTDTHLWAERYDRPVDDVFAIQSEVANAVASQLQARLSPQEKVELNAWPTTDIQAYQLYLRATSAAHEYTTPAEMLKGEAAKIALLTEATRRDPKFVRAYCELASAHDNMYAGRLYATAEEKAVDHRTLAEVALQQALRLGSDVGRVHLAVAHHLKTIDSDNEQVRLELEAARRTLPNDPELEQLSGMVARSQGRWRDAVRDLEKAASLQPGEVIICDDLVWVYRSMRRYADADRASARVIALRPREEAAFDSFFRATGPLEQRADLAPLRRCVAEFAPANDADRATKTVFSLIVALCSHDPAGVERALAAFPAPEIAYQGFRYPSTWFKGLAARMRRDDKAARVAFAAARVDVEKRVLANPDNAKMLSLLGMIDAGLGQKDDAVREGRRACEMLPQKTSAPASAVVESNLAVIYAWTNQPDLAFAALGDLAGRAAGVNLLYQATYGDLRLNPVWAPLQSDPRYTALLKRLAVDTNEDP
jgi:serine/threonine-protein kinase